MNALREVLSWTWNKMNPVEPSVAYLATFMAVAVAVMAVGILIGAA